MNAASLEEYVLARLQTLGFDDVSQAEYCLGIMEEESLEAEDKEMAILGILEVEEDEGMQGKVREMISDAETVRERLEQEAEQKETERAAALAAALKVKPKTEMTPEEEAARRKELIKSFGYLDEDSPTEIAAKAGSANEGKPSIVMPDQGGPTSKKARKKAEAGMDILMSPNVNSALVKGAELQRRMDDAAKAAGKREKDKGDLKKQKEDAIKKASDKTKKAAKQERRA